MVSLARQYEPMSQIPSRDTIDQRIPQTIAKVFGCGNEPSAFVQAAITDIVPINTKKVVLTIPNARK